MGRGCLETFPGTSKFCNDIVMKMGGAGVGGLPLLALAEGITTDKGTGNRPLFIGPSRLAKSCLSFVGTSRTPHRAGFRCPLFFRKKRTEKTRGGRGAQEWGRLELASRDTQGGVPYGPRRRRIHNKKTDCLVAAAR